MHHIMRTLYISTYTPVPAFSGHSRRIGANFEALRAIGPCRLVILGYKPPLAVRQQLSRVDTRVFPPRSEPVTMRAFRHASALMRGESAWLAKSLSAARIDRLRDEVRAFKPDAIVLGDTWLSPLIKPLGPLTGQIVVDNHNAESRLYRRMIGASRGVQRVKAMINYVNMRQMERRLPLASKIWAVSDEDRQFFSGLLDASRIHTIPNVVDGPADAGSAEAESPRAIAFVGSYGYLPNQNAALALIAISKRLKREGIEHELWIVGNSPTPDMFAAAKGEAQITITGLVPDTGTYVAKAAIIAAPLNEGSGTKFKLLEAMAYGRPIVTTPIGAEGLELTPGREVVIAHDDAEFAAAIRQLLADPARRRLLGEGARRKLAEHFSMDVLVTRIRASLEAPA